jgi:DNA-binding NarL/FixJ family response regulator
MVRSILGAHKQLHVVGEAVDGVEAVQKAGELKPDVIVLDIGLPKVNGIEVANRIRQLAPGTKIIFFTQNADADVRLAALSSGARGYVLKANAGQELLSAVETTLHDSVGSGSKV